MKLKRRVDTVAHLYESGFRTLQVTGEGHVQALEERIKELEQRLAVEEAHSEKYRAECSARYIDGHLAASIELSGRIALLEAENQRLRDGVQNLLLFTPYTKEQVGAIAALLQEDKP
jgi:hypothetical protein